MRKLALLAAAVLTVSVLAAGCGGGTQPTSLAPRSLSLSIRDNPSSGVAVLSFVINVTGASLQPSDLRKPRFLW